MFYENNGVFPINYSVSYKELQQSKEITKKTNPTFIGTKELAQRLGITPHTLRVWVSNGKQAKEGFPKPNHRLKELQFRMKDIIDWENGKRF